MKDNYDLWLEHEIEMEKALSKRPVCQWCGNPIQDDYCYEIKGEMVCEHCIEDCMVPVD